MKYRIKGIGDSHPVQKDFNKYMNTKPSKLVKEVTNNIIKKYGEKWDISPRILKSRKVWWIPALIEVGNIVEKRAKEEEQKDIFEIAENGKKLGYNSNNALGLIENIQRVLMKRRLKIIKEKA